jgi:acyl-CoA synthetase (NDP forming)
MQALDTLFSARSIAVIGASRHREKVGYQVLRNLQSATEVEPRPKKLYPINPTAQSILGLPVHPSITAIKDPIDVVVIVTPASTVIDLVEEIIERNRPLAKKDRVKAVIIITAGFAETSKEGRNVQHAIATKLTLAGIRVLGPNTLGAINPIKFFNASFAQRNIGAGNLAVISQSGAMLTALFDALTARQVGVSFAVSLGNKADLSENDCIEYAFNDPHTHVVAMYLESFAHLPLFFEKVSKLSKKKPVLLLKGGTSQRGQKASASHTAALATNQVLLGAGAQQMGFVLVDNMEELINLSFFLAQHHKTIESTVVITNAGGPAVNTIDELSNRGVKLAKWSEKSEHDFDDLLPRLPIHNPLDLLGDASPEHFQKAISVAQRDLNIDSMVVIVTPQAVTDIPGIVNQIIELKGKKPILVSLMGGDHLEKYRQQLREHHILCAAFPNDLVDVLKFAQQISQYHFKSETFIQSDVHTPPVQPYLKVENWGIPHPMPSLKEVFALLEHAKFTLPKYNLITQHNLSELKTLQYPLFVKTANLSLIHKKKIGAVYGVVHNAEEGHQAYEAMQKFGNEVLFQELIEIQHELLLGINNDPQFGLYLTVGLGGSYTNILADRAYAFLPANKSYLEKMWRSTKAFVALKELPQISEMIPDAMFELQRIVMQNPWIQSIEINPLAITPKGPVAADIKITPMHI